MSRAPGKKADQRTMVAEIVEVADQIQGLVDLGRSTFDDPATHVQDAIKLRVIYLGEASSKVGGSFQKANPRVPWKRMWQARIRVGHPYTPEGDLDQDELWEYAAAVVPVARRRLRRPVYTDRG